MAYHYRYFIIDEDTYERYLSLPASIHLSFERVNGCIVVYHDSNKNDWSWMDEKQFEKKWVTHNYKGLFLGNKLVRRKP